MPAGIALPAAPHPAAAEGGDRIGRALHGGALHVVQHSANAAQLLAASRASRGRHEPAARAASRVRSTPWRSANSPPGCAHDTAQARARNDSQERRRRRTRTRPGCPRRAAQAHRIARISVGNHGGHRSECLDLVDRLARHARPGTKATAAAEKRRARRSGARTSNASSLPATSSASRRNSATRAQHLGALRQAHERPHAHALGARIADDDFAERCPRGRPPRHRRCAAGTRALRMAVHFWPALTVISRTTSRMKRSNSARAGRRVRGEDAGIERIGLGGEGHGVADHSRMHAQRARRCRADPVKHTMS